MATPVFTVPFMPSSGSSNAASIIDRMPVRNRADLLALEDVPLAERIAGLSSTLAIFERSAQTWPQRIALTFVPDGDPQAVPIDFTYLELRNRIVQTANLLASLGLQASDCVVYLLPIVPETHFVAWGVQAVCQVAAINHFLEPAQLAELLKTLNPKVIVTAAPELAPELWRKISPLLAALHDLRATFVVGAATNDQQPPPELPSRPAGVSDFNTALRAQPIVAQFVAPTESDRVAACFHTGGTTGTPKVAQLSHGALVANTWMLGEILDLQPTDVVACGLPLFHVNGVIITGLAVFTSGARVVLAGANGYRNPALIPNFWKLVERYRVTIFSAVPTVYAALLNVPIGAADLSSLRFGICGAAPIPVETFKRFERATGIRLLEGFGMTETSAIASVNPRDGERRVGSIGLPVPYTRMKIAILDEQGQYLRDAHTHEIGNVAIHGPHLISSFKDVRHNAGLWLPDGWLNSGDLGRVDDEGYFWLCGRAKDVIIRGGHNIDPATLEEALAQHPDVALVAAVGRPDAYAGELPVAYVTLRPGAQVDAETLKAFAKAHVTERAAAPMWVECLATMPMTAVGKIFKPALRKRAIERTLHELLAAAGLRSAITVEDDPKHAVVARVRVANEGERAQAEALCAELTVHVRCEIAPSPFADSPPLMPA